MGSGGKGRTENRRDVSGAGHLHHWKEVHQEESAADHQSDDRPVRGDTAECCSVSEISI